MIRGVAGEHVGQARLDAHSDERQPAGRLPLVRSRELFVAELDAGQLVRPLGVRVGQGHRHVQVVGPGRGAAVEDRHDEARVDGVEDVGRSGLADQGRDSIGVRGVHAGRGHAGVAGARDGGLGAPEIVVGDDDVLEEVAPQRGRDEGAADAAGADDQDPHGVVAPRDGGFARASV